MNGGKVKIEKKKLVHLNSIIQWQLHRLQIFLRICIHELTRYTYIYKIIGVKKKIVNLSYV